jgi:hypothetical protein
MKNKQQASEVRRRQTTNPSVFYLTKIKSGRSWPAFGAGASQIMRQT